MEILLVILIILVLTLGYTTFNLYNKQGKSEKIMAGYLFYLDQISRVIEASNIKLKELDDKGSFKSDDEIGFFFEQVKQIQEILNNFRIKEH